MITPYNRPQSKITQILRATPAVAVARSNAIVIGPEYLLALADGRDLPTFAFAAAGADLPYKYLNSDGVAATLDGDTHKVKLDSVKLFGTDLEALAATLTTLERKSDQLNALRLPSGGSTNLSGGTLVTALAGRNVKVGDRVSIGVDNATAGTFVTADQTFNRAVVGLIPRTLPGTVNSLASGAAASLDSVGNAAANAAVAVADVSAPGSYSIIAANVTIVGNAAKFFEIGGRFNGKVGEEITLTCVTAGINTAAQFRVDYSALGESEVVTSAAGTGGTEFVLTLTKYNNSTVKIVITGSAAVLNQVARFKVFPIHAKNLAGTIVVDSAEGYTGETDTTYIVEVTKGVNNASGTITGAKLKVYDTTGKEPVQTYEATGTDFADSLPLGTRGLTFTIDSAAVGFPDLVTGDKFLFNVVAAAPSSSEFDGIVLDGPAYDPALFDVASGKFSVEVRVPFTGEITDDNVAAGTAFAADADGVSYVTALGILTEKTSSAFCSFVDGRGTLKVSYKASKLVGATDKPTAIRSDDDIRSAHGEISLENDLAYGAYWARNGAQQRTVYTLRVSEDTVEAWTAALRKIESADIYYALAALTESEEIMQLVTDHCEKMSDPEHQAFRRCYVGTDSPGSYTMWGALSGGGYRRATLIGDLVTIHEDDRAVSDLTLAKVRAGDTVKFFSLSNELEVVEVVSAYEVRVVNTNSDSISTAAAFTLEKPDTADNTIDFVAARSAALSSRRCVNVWCDRPTIDIDGETQVVPSRFIAAEIAGLRSVLLPQQGLTTTIVESITAAPAMYARFTPEDLDRAAANGTMVISQDMEGGEIAIRHQLTTETNNGALQYEDNVGVVVDAFSYQVKDAFRGYIGKKNVVAATIDDIRAKLKQLAIDGTQPTLPQFEEIGPMIVSFADEDSNEGEVTVRRDSVLADSLLTYTKLRVPLPLNGLHHYVDAEMAFII